MTDDKQRLENARWLFERTLGWIATADAKTAIVVAIDTAMAGGLAAAYGASDAGTRTAWAYAFLVTSSVCLVAGIFCAAMAAIPRMLGPVKSMIYFKRVVESPEAEYVKKFEAVTEKQFLDDLVTQIHRNSQIASEKHLWVRRSLYWSFLAAIPWVPALIWLVKT